MWMMCLICDCMVLVVLVFGVIIDSVLMCLLYSENDLEYELVIMKLLMLVLVMMCMVVLFLLMFLLKFW